MPGRTAGIPWHGPRSSGTTRAHIVRAVLEGIVYRTREALDALLTDVAVERPPRVPARAEALLEVGRGLAPVDPGVGPPRDAHAGSGAAMTVAALRPPKPTVSMLVDWLGGPSASVSTAFGSASTYTRPLTVAPVWRAKS